MKPTAEAGIHRLAIPTPFQVGRVNAYLIEDEPLTLVDSGPNSAKALDELEQALAAHGHAVEDLELLVISHQHMDHFGLASILARPLDADPEETGRHAQARPRALLTYLESLERTREMDLSLVLPGHGEPITDHVALIEERFRMHRRRAEKIARLIASGPRTAHELAQELWGNVAVTQAYLTLSEILGHVDLLLAEGRVIE